MEITKQVKLDISHMPTISVCMIVKNEEKNLENLLPILYKSADEIIIVDTGSNDETIKKAMEYTTNVYNYIWENSFAKARNESLKYATKDYVLWLDADDVITKQDIAKLRFHLMKNPNTAVFVNLVDKKLKVEHRARQLRVFPNHQGIEFRKRVHEQVSFSIEEKGIQYSNSDICIFHFGYSSKELAKEKSERNLMLLFYELGEDSEDFFTNLEIGKTYLGLGMLKDAMMFTEKCIRLVEEDTKKSINREHAFLPFYTYFTICHSENKFKEAFTVLERNKERFSDNPLYKLAMGELYFRFKKYEEAYEELSILDGGKIPVGIVPVNQNVIRMLSNLYMLSSLYIGDLDTAESCIKRFINDPDFKIKRRGDMFDGVS